jgi:hypothetical protein
VAEVKTCANCGNTQATGDFCEKCGTRMPAAPPPAASTAQYGTPRASGPSTGGQPTGGQPSYSSPTYGPPSYGPPGYGSPPGYDYPRRKGFFSRLFDLSFEEFITPSIIKILFIISMIVIGLWVLGMIIFGFASLGAWGVIFLVGALIGGFLLLLYVRVILELFIVFFRIHDNTQDIAQGKR